MSLVALYRIISKNFIGGSDEDEIRQLYPTLASKKIIPFSHILSRSLRATPDISKLRDAYCEHVRNLAAIKKQYALPFAGISVKPSQLGAALFLSRDIFWGALTEIAEECALQGIECSVDIEGRYMHDYIYSSIVRLRDRKKLDISASFPANDPIVRNYFENFIQNSIRVRIVRSIPDGVLHEDDAIFVSFMSMIEIASRGKGIMEICMTDDDYLFGSACYLKNEEIPAERVRYQMPYGIRMRLQETLASGVDMRPYLSGSQKPNDAEIEALLRYTRGRFICYIPQGNFKNSFPYLWARCKDGIYSNDRALFLKNIYDGYRWRMENLS
jgi:hypothetical protein